MSEKYVLALDASQIKTFDGECQLMWAYLYRENLRLTGADSSAMNKGTIIHFLLEHFYKLLASNPNLQRKEAAQGAIDIFQKVIKESPEASFGFDKDLLNFLCQRFIQYVYNYTGRDLVPATNKTNGVVGIELGFSKILHEDENVLFLLEGRIDLLHNYDVNGNEVLCVVDHKTQDRETHLFDFRPQMLTYALAADTDYAMINYVGLQKELTKTSLRRQGCNIPKWMREEWKEYILKNIFWPIYWIEKFNESNEVKFRRNRSSCAGAFDSHPCMFTQLCWIQNNELRENLKKSKYEKVPKWEPWKMKIEEVL